MIHHCPCTLFANPQKGEYYGPASQHSERGSVEARDYLCSRDGYKASKRKFRERLATYEQIRKEI